MKKRLIGAVLALMTVVTIGAGCGKKPSQTLTIGVLPDVDSIPIIIAQEKGFFEAEGLDIDIQHFKSAPDRESALQAGSLDGAVSDMLSAAFLTEGGFEVGITSMTNGSYKLLAGASMNGSTDLTGKSIAISTNTIIEYTTDMMLAENGLSPEDVEKTAIPQIPVRLEMLQSGQIDAATLPEPLASVAVKAGATVIGSSDSLGINPGVLLFTKDSISQKKTEIEAFYRAYNKAVENLKSAPVADYVDILINVSGFPEDVRDQLTLPEYTSATLPGKEDFDGVIAWLTEKGLIQNAYQYDDLVVKDFVK